MIKRLLSLVCTAASLILMLRPNALPMGFATSPTDSVYFYYSYGSPTPFFYAHCAPMISLLLSVVVVLLLLSGHAVRRPAT